MGKQIVNINGRLHAPDEAKISVYDRGFLYGDSIYETLRTYGQRPFLIDRHMKRLEISARMLQLELPRITEEIQGEIVRTVDAASNEESYIRLIVTRGVGRIGLDIHFSEKASYVIIVNPLEPLPEACYQEGVAIVIVSVRRNDRTMVNPRIKSSNLLNNVLAYNEAKQQGAFEGVLCNMAGLVSECTGSNIFMIKNGELVTPPPEAGLLEGVTRALTLEQALAQKVAVAERNVTPEELLEADECFITSTTKEILPVRRINQTNLSPVPGPVTAKLMKAYQTFVSNFLRERNGK